VKIIIVGGGIIGSTHALAALAAGHEVLHLERDPIARSASVRNFGLIWVSGRKSGTELAFSLRARQLWDEISNRIPNLSLRANGSLTLAINSAEVAVMEECVKKTDAHDRGWELLSKSETIRKNPALNGEYLAALYCPHDATVEPGSVLESIRSYLLEYRDNQNKRKYQLLNNMDIVDVQEFTERVTVTARSGEKFDCDKAIIAPGADHHSLFAEQLSLPALRKVRIQMMSTAPLDLELTTSIADGDSMRYYPGYDVPALTELPAQDPIAAEKHVQLLMVQRLDGTLTIGDTHEYSEPFDFALDERPYRYLHEVASNLIGAKLPDITRRWDGVYSQRSDGAICDRQFISPNIITVTGPGGRGNTLAPAIAEETLTLLKG